jgi:hypothetical protein
MTRHSSWLLAASIASVLPSMARAGCDLTTVVTVGREALSDVHSEAVLSVRRDRIALIGQPGSFARSLAAGDVTLLELRDNGAVEVGFIDLHSAGVISKSFVDRIGEIDAELVVGTTQSAFVGDIDCEGVDWAASPVSAAYFQLSGTDVETRVTRAQIYEAIAVGQDLRAELIPPLAIDLRRGERLSEHFEYLPIAQPSLVVRPIVGRLSKSEVHIPSFALRAPREEWLADEIHYLSRIEDADWQLGKATWEVSLSYSSDNRLRLDTYFPISEYWSGEVGASAGHGSSTSFAFERAFLWPDREVFGTLSFGRLDGEYRGIAVSAVQDLGQAQWGGSLSLGQSETRFAAFFERSFGRRSHAWLGIETEGSDRSVSIGLSREIRSDLTADLELRRDEITDDVKVSARLEWASAYLNGAKLSVSAAERSLPLRSLRRNAEVMRSARGDEMETQWTTALQ